MERVRNKNLDTINYLPAYNNYLPKHSFYKVGSDIVNFINKLPFQFHLPGHNYTGPGTNLLLNMEKGLKPINDVDKAALEHDIEYFENKDLEKRHEADKKLEQITSKIPSVEAKMVSTIMNVKQKLGLGVEENFKKFLEEKKSKKIVVKPKEGVRLSLDRFVKLFFILKQRELIIFNPKNCYDFEEHKKNNTETYQFYLSKINEQSFV